MGGGNCGCGDAVDYGPGLRDGNLGFAPLAVLSVAREVVNLGKDVLGGESPWLERTAKAYKGDCPGTPPLNLVLAGVASAPRSLLQAISDGLRAATPDAPNPSELGDPNTVRYWVWSAMGGSDCRVTSKDPRVSQLPALVQQLADLGRGFSANTTGVAGGSGSTPVLIADYGDSMPANTPAQPVPGPSLWDQIKDIAVQAGKDAVRAGASTAVQQTYTALPDYERARVDQYAAGAYSRSLGQTLQDNLPLLLAGGIGLALLLRK